MRGGVLIDGVAESYGQLPELDLPRSIGIICQKIIAIICDSSLVAFVTFQTRFNDIFRVG